METIRCNLKNLVEQKEASEGRKITYRDIKEETGININTVTALMNDKWTLIGRITIERLLHWIPCEPSELFITQNGGK